MMRPVGNRYRAIRSLIVCGCTLMLAGIGPVRAHAIVVEASPGDGAVLASAPEAVVLRFNAKIERGLSRITLAGNDGQVLDLKAGDAPARRANVLYIPVPALHRGHYTVRYKVLASDGHATQGAIRFRISGNLRVTKNREPVTRPPTGAADQSPVRPAPDGR